MKDEGRNPLHTDQISIVMAKIGSELTKPLQANVLALPLLRNFFNEIFLVKYF